jgi:uncharacterized low-complexity protein
MTLLGLIKAAGAHATLDPNGQVRISRASLLAPELLVAARQIRGELVQVLADEAHARAALVAALLTAARDAEAALAESGPDYVSIEDVERAAMPTKATSFPCGPVICHDDRAAALLAGFRADIDRLATSPPGVSISSTSGTAEFGASGQQEWQQRLIELAVHLLGQQEADYWLETKPGTCRFSVLDFPGVPTSRDLGIYLYEVQLAREFAKRRHCR